MEGKWTFTDLNKHGWVHMTYDTKEEAIQEAKKLYKVEESKHIVVGQLIGNQGTYYVENQEYVTED